VSAARGPVIELRELRASGVASRATSSYHLRVLTSPTSPVVANGPFGAAAPAAPAADPFGAFKTGDLVELFTDSVRALARVRESSESGRLHIAFEMGEYFPWVDAAVLIRHAGVPAGLAARPCTARILHAGTSTALLQLLHALEELPPGREPYDTIPLLDE
jgi:hypothetical protein